MAYDVIIAGGGVGGCAAALGAARLGGRVLLVEETDWIGGQFTAQAVPPDEHPVIEKTGCTAMYRQFREKVRDYYRRNFPLTEKARKWPELNPGNGTVSRLCMLPRVGVGVLYEMMSPYMANGQVTIMLKHKIKGAETNGDYVKSFTFEGVESGKRFEAEAKYFIDATEVGDGIAIAGAEYVTGAESRSQTHEDHAIDGEAEPLNMEAITHCMVLDYIEGEDHTIEKPKEYDFWKEYKAGDWPGPQLGWVVPHVRTNKPDYEAIFAKDENGKLGGLFFWRKIFEWTLFEPGYARSDMTVVNWMHNDFWLGPIYEVSEEEAAKNRYMARQLSLSFLYWMQTEAPRYDGGNGYPGLRLRGDVTGTADGLAKYPYIRESRRIKAEFTILEHDINRRERAKKGAEIFEDSVGIGFYNIDIHPTTAGVSDINVEAYPFQIPLGAMLPVRVENLLPGCKNIGTTHVTNGAYREHPIEWNIGESAGYLAMFCAKRDLRPRQVWEEPKHLRKLQEVLSGQGVMLEWPEEYRLLQFK